jgi:hypothetical protein
MLTDILTRISVLSFLARTITCVSLSHLCLHVIECLRDAQDAVLVFSTIWPDMLTRKLQEFVIYSPFRSASHTARFPCESDVSAPEGSFPDLNLEITSIRTKIRSVAPSEGC